MAVDLNGGEWFFSIEKTYRRCSGWPHHPWFYYVQVRTPKITFAKYCASRALTWLSLFKSKVEELDPVRIALIKACRSTELTAPSPFRSQRVVEAETQAFHRPDG